MPCAPRTPPPDRRKKYCAGHSLQLHYPLTLQNERENPEGIVERDGVGLSAFRSAVQLKQLRQLPA